MISDPDENCKNGSELLDRLLKVCRFKNCVKNVKKLLILIINETNNLLFLGYRNRIVIVIRHRGFYPIVTRTD